MNIRHVGTRVAALRDHNQSLVLRQILLHRGMSRTEIATRIGLTDAAVSRITRDLIASGLVREGPEAPAEPGQRGRRHVQLEPDGTGAGFLAVNLTVSDRRVSLVDLAGQRRAEAALPSNLQRDYDALMAKAADIARRLPSQARFSRARILGVAVTTAGAVDQTTGLVSASSLTILQGRDVGGDLGALLGTPVIVETVGNAFGLAEAHRATRQRGAVMSGPSLLVHGAFGLGVSVMLDGVPVRTGGDERLASHLQVAGAHHRCICGATGCLMTEAAGYGVLRRLDGVTAAGKRQSWEDMRPEALRAAIAASRSGDPAAASAMTVAGRTLGRHLFALGAAVTPQRILLGGPLAASPQYVEGLRAGLAEAFSTVSKAQPALLVSTIDYLQAAEILAIEEFALRRPLSLERRAT
jgi:predicted NBD/HSP70 family sugar kinase